MKRLFFTSLFLFYLFVENFIPLPAQLLNPLSRKEKMILILLKTQWLVALEKMENGEFRVVYTFRISSGKNGSTPTGLYKIYNKSSMAFSRAFKVYMPYWMAFTPDGRMGLHGLPLKNRKIPLGGHLIGRPASHGCVRLRLEDAQKLFQWAEVGTIVQIINSLVEEDKKSVKI